MTSKGDAAKKDNRQIMWAAILLVVVGLGSALYGAKHYVRCDTETYPMSTARDTCR